MTALRPIGFWLKVVDGLIDDRFAATLEEHGLTRRQWQLLNVLARGDASLSELDAAVAPFLESGSSQEELDELLDSDWVAYADHLYALTERGREALDRLLEVVEQVRGSLTRDISEDEYAATVGVLERMARNLGWEG